MLPAASRDLREVDTKLKGTIGIAQLRDAPKEPASVVPDAKRVPKDGFDRLALSELQTRLRFHGVTFSRSAGKPELAQLLREAVAQPKAPPQLPQPAPQLPASKSVAVATPQSESSKPKTFEEIAMDVGFAEDRVAEFSKKLDELTGQSRPKTSEDLVTLRAELLIRRGHANWEASRYAAALADFDESSKLQRSAAANLSTAALCYCCGWKMKLEDLDGQETAQQLFQELVDSRRMAVVEMTKHIFHPQQVPAIKDERGEKHHAASDIRMFDGVCHVGIEGDDFFPPAEIGYRLFLNEGRAIEETPLLIYYHGNGEVAAEYERYADMYAEFPCTCIVFDYRGYGWSTGTPSMLSLGADARQCMHQLPELFHKYALPWPWPAPVVLQGRSLGCVVVPILVGKFPDLFDGLILDSGFASDWRSMYKGTLDMAGPHKAELEARKERLHKLVEESLPTGCSLGQRHLASIGSCDVLLGYRGSVMVIHASGDTLVSPDNGKRNYEATLFARSREFVTVPGGHNTLASVPKYWQEQKKFLKEVVVKSSSSKV